MSKQSFHANAVKHVHRGYFFFLRLLFSLIVLSKFVSPTDAAGPLSVKISDPAYFVDSTGSAVHLTGSYFNEYNGSWNFTSHLDFLQQQNQNFTRVWAWERSPSIQAYERTGPGRALDGALKYDLTRFNQAYFDQLRSRVLEAAARGIYISVALFECFGSQGDLNPWVSHPFNRDNNVNRINGDRNRNGAGEELFSLAFPALVTLQESFIRKVIDTLNDLDNVLYDVSGNGLAESLSWQYHMIDYVKRYQSIKPNQHPVGISHFDSGGIVEVFNSSSDWIGIDKTNSTLATGKKIVIVEGNSESGLFASPISLIQLSSDPIVSSQTSTSSTDTLTSNGLTTQSSSNGSTTYTTESLSIYNRRKSQVATPTISPNGGSYSGTVSVGLQTITQGASIYYTTNGQSPNQSSRKYTGPFTLSGSTLVKAKAFKKNFEPSSEASAWFTKADSVSVPGLVAHWKFDEGSGTKVTDSSGSGNNGTLVNGPVWTAGKVGNALYFDGINDNVTVADSNSLDLSNFFTLSAWVNPASTFTDFRSILVKNYSYYLYASVAGYCGDGTPLGGFSGITANTACQPSPLPINTWTYLAVTYNGSSLTFYRDGVAVTTTSVSGSLSPTSGTLQIGGSQFGEYFKGLIDEVRIYNKALNDTEIQNVYQQDSPTPVQTVATPVISPSGGDYTNSVPVTMQTATSSASIHYTTDGSTPTQSSTMYAGTVTLTKSATMKAKAFKSGSNPSTEATASFTVAQPFSFSLANSGDKAVIAGSSVNNSIAATLVSGTTQAVSFSVSGLPSGATASLSSASCSPSCSSTLTISASSSTAAGSSPITVTASGGGITKTTTFSLNVSAQTVATPVISPNGGNYTSSATVTMQTATSAASIYYTTNGSTPTQSSTLYTGAVTLTSSADLKAKAFKSGLNPSAEASASFIVTPAGLIAYWKFDEGSGTTTGDASGNGNSGTLVNGPVWSAGRVGKALLFDGINDHVTVADSNSLDLSSAFTLSAWVNPASTFTDFRSILVKNYSYYLYASVASYCGDGTPLGGFSGITAQTACQPSPLPVNTWTHLAVTYNGSTLTFYRDGVAVATSSASGTLSPTTGVLQIGGSQFGEYFKGLIDEVRIYNKALSATEIQTAYQQDSGGTSPTVSPVIPGTNQPFSFSLANSGNKSVVAGSSVTNSIAAALVSGTSQTVSFGVSGLPSGANGSFSSTSCTPACSTVLNISSSTSTPAGNFPITITSTGGDVTKTTAFTLSVTVPTPTNTSGATYWVAKTGSDSNSCAQAQSQGGAKLTINAGIACMRSGDTLYIMAGTYLEHITSLRSHVDGSCTSGNCVPNGTAGAWTKIHAAPGHERQAIVRSDGNGALYFDGPQQYVEVKGLVLDPNREGAGAFSSSRAASGLCHYDSSQGGYFCAMQNGSAPAYPTNILLENNEMRNCSKSCVFGWGEISAPGVETLFEVADSGVVIRGNDVHDCGSDGFDHCMYVGGKNIIENNRIWHAAGFAIQGQDVGSYYGSNGSTIRGNLIWDSFVGISVQEFNKKIYNNVIFKSGSTECISWLAQFGSACQLGLSGTGAGIYALGAGTAIVANNTMYNMAVGLKMGFGTFNMSWYNNACVGCSLNSTEGGSVQGIMEVFEDNGAIRSNNLAVTASALVNPSSQNFQIASATGPLTNVGTSAPSGVFNFDANGASRPQGGAWDVGACEQFSGASSCPNFQGTTPPTM